MSVDMSLKESILPSVIGKTLLFGLLRDNVESENYLTRIFGAYELAVKRKETPGKYSRLDLLYINMTPVGSIVSMEVIAGLYHMAGMYIIEEYRLRNIEKTLPGLLIEMRSANIVSPASFLLQSYLFDMVGARQNQITLEVTNNNERAWRLYESPLLTDPNKGVRYGFELLSKSEIEQYAKCRRKKIKRWYDIESKDEAKGYGVQWEHIQDYGGRPERWSNNRIYLIKPAGTIFILSCIKYSQIKSLYRIAKTIVLHGSLYQYLIFKFKALVSRFSA